MALDVQPAILARVGSIPLEDGFQVSPPVWWVTSARQWHDESGSAIEDGRFIDSSHEIEAQMQAKWQDTYITGTPSRTGRAFDVVAGTWQTDSISAWSNRYAVLMNDGRNNTTFEIKDNASTANGLQPAMVIIRRGVAPKDSPHAKTDNYAYLELAASDTVSNYRIALEFGRPIRLDYKHKDQFNAAWQLGVADVRQLGNLESYLRNNNEEIWLRISPDQGRGVLTIEVGSGHYLRHSPRRSANSANPNAPASLPTTEQYRLSGKNGWIGFEVYPGRYGPLTVRKARQQFYRSIPNLQDARGIVNLAGSTETGQSATVNVRQDSEGYLDWDATASLPDAGDGLGSTKPSRFADVTIYIPSIWWTHLLGDLPEADLRVMRVVETQVWDDENRIGRTFGHLAINNSDWRYNRMGGNYALNLTASNGTRYGQRVRGVMGFGLAGVEHHIFDPVRFTTVQFSDFFTKMERQLEQEIELDGVSLPTALRLVFDIGQIGPKFLQKIPPIILPPYPDNYPEYILAKGTGQSPKYRYEPQETAVGVLLDLLRDSGAIDPIFGRAIPYYAYFDRWGAATIEAYDPSRAPIVKHYGAVDPTGEGQIIDEPLIINNSTEQLRTHVTIQGQDAYTYELLQYHMELPWNYALVGWRKGLLERNQRYGSPLYTQRAGLVGAVQSSLGSQILRFKAVFDPNVFAGNVFAFSHPRFGTGLYNIIRMTSSYGDSYEGTDCYSWITGRSLINSVPLV